MTRIIGREPVKETCPLIDEMIDTLKEDMCANIDYYISSLEEIREANSSLRKWGHEESKRVDELENEVYELRKNVDNLEADVDSLNRIIDKANL